jgi:hypothetical protein
MNHVLLFRDRERERETKQLKRISKDSQEKLQKTISTIILLTTPLSSSSLANLLGLSQRVVNNRIKNPPAVLIVETEHDNTVSILHTLFRNFLLHESRLATFNFWVDEQQTHQMLAKSCSSLMKSALKENIRQVQDPSVLTTDPGLDQFERHLPREAQYACLNWVEHIEKGGALLDSDDYQFPRTHFFHWLEAMAWMGKLFEAILAVTK